jgi:ankyrin repeat protein
MIPTKHVFLSYAIRFWLVHLQEAVSDGTPIEEIDKESIIADQGMINPDAHRGLGNFLVHSNAIKLAAKGGHNDCFDFLEQAFNIPSLEDEQYKTVFQDTARKGHTRLLGKVLRMRRSMVKDLVVALIEAFPNGHKAALDELAKHYAVLRDTDHFGMNALHAVFAYGHGTFSHSNDPRNIHDGNINACIAIYEYLISNGVDPSSRDRNRFTALHWACSDCGFYQKAIIRVPVSYGARVSHPALGGLIPLHLAAYYADTADVLSYLLELSSKLIVTVASGSGMRPLH